jgi:hypothetical protein
MDEKCFTKEDMRKAFEAGTLYEENIHQPLQEMDDVPHFEEWFETKYQNKNS